MFMLQAMPTTKYPFQLRNICILAGAFFMSQAGNPQTITGYFKLQEVKTLKNKESLLKSGGTTPTQKKLHIPYQHIAIGAAAFAYFFFLQTDPVLASDMWTKAETIMKDVYGKILGISTVAAIVTASVALLLMNFSKSGKTVDESRAWLKRIIISWVVLNSLGFIMAYITPFFSDGKWNG